MPQTAHLTISTFFLFAAMLLGLGKAEAQLSDGDRKVIEWFDGLSFPRLENAKLALVATGLWSQSGNDPPKQAPMLALLLSEQGDSFTVLTLDLETRHYTKSPADTPVHERVGFEVRDLHAEVMDQLKQLDDPDKQNSHMFGDWDGERVKLFTLARACVAQNHDAAAHRLLEAAASLPTKHHSFSKALSEDIAYLMTWRAIVDFGDLSISRADLLARFREVQRDFPNSKQAKRVTETVAILEKMVAEDNEQRRRKPLSELTGKERVAELVFLLRDQNGRQRSQPGSCDIFEDSRGEESPAAQLRKMGFEAIPELLGAIEDTRFTRSVEFHRDYYFSHRVVTIGKCAEEIIFHIAHRSFGDRRDENVKHDIELWWNEVKEKGEMQVLVESTSQGDDNSLYQAKVLIEKYPSAAFAAIRQGISQGKNEWTRTQLVELISTLKDDAVQDLLLDQMNNAPGSTTRVAAANGLLTRNRPEPIPAMIKEWRNAALPTGPGNDATVAKFLAHCGSSEAIRALSEGLSLLSVDFRLYVVSEFDLENDNYQGRDEHKQHIAKDAGAEAAIEELLITMLADTEPRLGMSGGVFGHSYTTNPRICDMSAYVLSKRFAEKYQFDVLTPLHERERQILLMQNTWRKEQNLAPLPSPERPHVERVPQEQIAPFLSSIAAAQTLEECRQPMTELERLGLPALPAINEFLETLAKQHPAQSELRTLASQLANLITVIEFEKSSFPPDKAVAELFNNLKGKQLDANNFVALLIDTVRALPEGACGATVSAYRYNDSRGVRLMLNLDKGNLPKDRSAAGWGTTESVDIDTTSIQNSSGSSAYDYAMEADSHDDFKKFIKQALVSSPRETFLVRAALQGSTE